MEHIFSRETGIYRKYDIWKGRSWLRGKHQSADTDVI